MRISRKDQDYINKMIRICFLSGAMIFMGNSVYAADITTTTLPTGGSVLAGNVSIPDTAAIENYTMNITQTGKNAVIQWQDFSIGANAAVNFVGDTEGFNTLNYVNSGSVSNIYGSMTANNNGNIFVVNTAGVIIGKSAQINVGSLYVSNKTLDTGKLANGDFAGSIDSLSTGTQAAELMSLGNINAEKVTFDGDRIVLDINRIVDSNGDELAKLDETNGAPKQLIIKTTAKDAAEAADEVIMGYDSYSEEIGTDGKIIGYNTTARYFNVYVSDSTDPVSVAGNRWVKNLTQLQAMNTNLGGYYALYNSIDAISTKDNNFVPIGVEIDGGNVTIKESTENGETYKGFYGKFDGLDYNIFGLQINSGSTSSSLDYVGLFGYTSGATINNVTLVSGNTSGTDIVGNQYVGSVVGYATSHTSNDGTVVNTVISNVQNSNAVIGNSDVGGIVGYATNGTVIDGAINTATVQGYENVGGLVGSLLGSSLIGTTYNLGSTYGDNSTDTTLSEDDDDYENNYYSHNIGGLVGYAAKSVIGNGNDETQIFNQLNVTGGYNVGGIVGSVDDTDASVTSSAITSTTIMNVANNGNITANGYYNTDYKYNIGQQNDSGTVVTSKDGGQGILLSGSTTGPTDTAQVHISNVGGIVGNVTGASTDTSEASGNINPATTISNVENTGEVKTATKNDNGTYKKITYSDTGTASAGSDNIDYYIGGNVGGIVGLGTDVLIENATVDQTEVAGAHNVGGIAGSLTQSVIDTGFNTSTTVTATGAISDNGFVMEDVRQGDYTTGSREIFVIGNTGGIAGYTRDSVIENSANSGTISNEPFYYTSGLYIENKSSNPTTYSTEYVLGPANTGGIVGRIDNSHPYGQSEQFSVQSSYNTGSISGFTGIGGIVGTMYNGSVGYTYNLGNISSARRSSGISPLNMGGIVGDTTEQSASDAYIYNSFNKGTIGDSTLATYGRHVGGIVGRLSGTVSTSYNTGDIYNAASTTGGIVGWWYRGEISNSFNTGNITGGNLNGENADGWELGGIAGGVSGNQYNVTLDIEIDDTDTDEEKASKEALRTITTSTATVINNAYNLGVLTALDNNGSVTTASIGGIVGSQLYSTAPLNINNVYTIGTVTLKGNLSVNYGRIYGAYNSGNDTGTRTVTNAVYIGADENRTYHDDVGTGETDPVTELTTTEALVKSYWNNFVTNSGNTTEEGSSFWRTYDNTTPILNKFTTGTMSSTWFQENIVNNSNVTSVQYGNAYDPFLTIVTSNGTNLSIDWDDAAFGYSEGLVVYGSGVTITDFVNGSGNTNIVDGLAYGGTIYSDGALSITAKSGEDITLGTGSKIYGSSVTITSDADVTAHGLIQATGNQNATTDTNLGDVTITGKNITITGQVGSAAANTTYTITGIEDGLALGNISASSNLGSVMAYTVTSAATKTVDNVTENLAGDITITAKVADSTDTIDGYSYGDVEILYGNNENGYISAAGDLTITGADAYVDADVSIGGDLTINADTIIFDGSNIGKVQYALGITEDSELDGAYKFMGHFSSYKASDTDKYADGSGKIIFSNKYGKYAPADGEETDTEYNTDAKLTIDLWDEDGGEDGEGAFNLAKYDYTDANGTTHYFNSYVLGYNLTLNGESDANGGTNVNRNATYIWVSTAEQLQGIQEYYNYQKKLGYDMSTHLYNILNFNFALKNDIDASAISDFVSIGTDSSLSDGYYAYLGTFDGRDNRIIGLEINNKQDNAGIFNTIGANGKFTNTRIYSTNVVGTSNAGLVAARNYGTISNITTYGNTIDIEDEYDVVNGNGGGIVGTNHGMISGVTSENVIMSDGTGLSDLGGIAGSNYGRIETSESNSALTASAGVSDTLGGIVGKNQATGELYDVISQGVASSLYQNSDGTYNITQYTGGIAGVNRGSIEEAYNESIVYGLTNVGGVVGANVVYEYTDDDNQPTTATGSLYKVANATEVTGGDNVGGLVGSNEGTITIGRNNGVITGSNDITTTEGTTSGGSNVGGLVGVNSASGELYTLTNDMAASVNGYIYVGGIVGLNMGTLSGAQNLMNQGSIEGHLYVGGIAGVNAGEISNITMDDSNLFSIKVNHTDDTTEAKYFGGIAGMNIGSIEAATNSAELSVEDASYVGGIVGQNGATADDITTLLGYLDSSNEAELKTKLYGESTTVTDVSGSLKGNVSNIGSVTGSNYVGGVIGLNLSETIEANNATVTNSGSVKATDGGAGGIIGENRANLSDLTMTNTGSVEGNVTTDATDGVGGVIGYNTGTLTNVTASNSGIVTGTTNVGGVIGYNAGAISKSSVYNTTDGTVAGTTNVGGIIGTNTASVAGGRDSTDDSYGNYYKYQIYNNGTVVGGSVNEDGTTTTSDTSSNIGGLIGSNSGTLQAAYNTGNVSGGSNVGGVVGSNAGSVDQVFNTLASTTGAISGTTNVGGIIGSNSGTLTNAYNTSAVSATGTNAVVGGVVGNNAGKLTSVYNSGTINGTENYSAIGSTDDENTWKTYNGKNPILKVFLTKAKVVWEETFTYDATEHEFTIGKYVAATDDSAAYVEILDSSNNNKLVGKIYAMDDSGSHNLEDYANTIDSDTLNQLIQGNSIKKAGTYTNFLSSEQINTDGTDNSPNNLGYDLVSIVTVDGKETEQDSSITVNKATISASLNDIYRQYGNSQIYSAATFTDDNKSDYGFTWTSTLTDAMKTELSALGLTSISDGAVDGLEDGQSTNDYGTYDWKAIIALGDLSENYQFSVNVDSIELSAKSYVEKAQLTVTLNQVQRTYGDKTITNNNGQYSYSVTGYQNGDENSYNNSNITISDISDGALTNAETGKATANRGKYEWTANATGNDTEGKINKNYTITVVKGESIVNAKKLTITLADVQRTYGEKELDTGYSYSYNIVGWVDDDEKAALYSGITMNESSIDDGALSKNTSSGRITNDVNVQGDAYEDYTWSATFSTSTDTTTYAGLANYEITTEAVTGKSYVTRADLTVDLSSVTHTYGTPNTNGYAIDDVVGLKNGEQKSTLKVAMSTDEALKDSTHTKDVQDASYGWEGTLSGIDNLTRNYNITFTGGESYVTPAALTIKANDVTAVYGGDFSAYGYTITKGLTNGDTDAELRAKIGDQINSSSYINTAAKDGTNGVKTANVKGTYTIDFVEAVKNSSTTLLNNYNITFEAGDATVTPRTISYTADNKIVMVGDSMPEFTGTDFRSQLVNGDERYLEKAEYGLTDEFLSAHPDILMVAASYDDSIVLMYTFSTGSVAADEFLNNYTLVPNKGTLTVLAPEIPNFPEKDGFWEAEDKYSWGRKREYRERKAEVHYEDGGMVLEAK